MSEPAVSTAPDGTRFPVPGQAEIDSGFAGLARRAEGKRVVVVQGLGFVGSAVAAAVAAARDGRGDPLYFVVGVDLPTPGGYWKVAKLNLGEVPFASPDPKFSQLVHDAVHVTGNLCATASPEAYALADTVVMDVHLDVLDRTVRDSSGIEVNLGSLEAAARAVGSRVRPGTLVLVETTVPFGTCRKVVGPAIADELGRRGHAGGLRLAYAYERVMPGPRYIDSIRGFWRTFAGVDAGSERLAEEFLSSFIDTGGFPLSRLPDTDSAELAKVLENSYRAANIAFIHEWTLLAEESGIDLWSVVDSIRVRKGTHDNMRYPGFGVGGYCLTKDSLLAQWSLANLHGSGHQLGVTLEALRINHEMPKHALGRLEEMCPDGLRGKRVLLCGVSYLADVGDTRHSPAEVFADAAAAAGATVEAHDPCIGVWPERPGVELGSDLAAALGRAAAVVFAVPHSEYRALGAAAFPKPVPVVDASNVLSDDLAEALHARGCKVAGVGKGHWRRRGFNL